MGFKKNYVIWQILYHFFSLYHVTYWKQPCDFIEIDDMIITRVQSYSSRQWALICANSADVYHWKQLEWQNWLLFAAFTMTKVSVFLIKQTTCLFQWRDAGLARWQTAPLFITTLIGLWYSVVLWHIGRFITELLFIRRLQPLKTSSFWNGPVSIILFFIYFTSLTKSCILLIL